MSSTLYTSIGELVTCDGPDSGTLAGVAGDGVLGIVRNAALVVEDGRIAWIGTAADAPDSDTRVDLEGRAVLPGFVDSHSHLVFDGDRAAEFAARMTGERYDGGGIGVSVDATRAASDERLRELVGRRVAEMRAQGTTTVEIKSGYGLTVEDEVRALRIAGEFTTETTFLGAHVVPPEARGDRAAYVELVTGPMLEACAPHAKWADVFCEPNSAHAFTEDESRAVLTAARDAGLELRVHGNQLGPGPGVRLAVELAAASVDHCTYLSDDDVDALVQASDTTAATLLPGVEFSTRSPYPDARRLIDAGVSVALATDCNPGTCYSDSMPFVIALAVREMGMTPSEAVWAATRGSARALRRDDIGRIVVGGPADLAVLDAPSHLHLAYRAGVPIARALVTPSGTSEDRPQA
ncbi:imidazolonepropionase [Knoellia subterranea]|uniref:Imidazolonepropionase n=1 Tax=Knoellia subterranea KCTC 19937 TaxID=1385521 RepID=A0A0A0JMF0_9MICO|nr:imidazolonepropionase [Knoellia subterranea]KGN37914.1 imidazolonepropionase [Knoellia subterranea KCTC 19937]